MNPFPAITIFAAMTRQRVIGINNTLPWRLAEDLKRFKALTMGHRIIMGRKTFESIGRALPGRENIVVSRGMKPVAGLTVAPSLDAALALPFCDEAIVHDRVIVIGGGQLYAETLQRFAPYVVEMHLTEIAQHFAGDAYFPAFSCPPWHEAARERHHQPGPPAIDFDFVTYTRAGAEARA
jgi:dihydrofolate reductase